MIVHYFFDDFENRNYMVIHYLLENDTGARIRNSIYIDKHEWIAEQESRRRVKQEELDFEQRLIGKHLGERGLGLAKKDFRKVTREEYAGLTSLISH